MDELDMFIAATSIPTVAFLVYALTLDIVDQLGGYKLFKKVRRQFFKGSNSVC